MPETHGHGFESKSSYFGLPWIIGALHRSNTRMSPESAGLDLIRPDGGMSNNRSMTGSAIRFPVHSKKQPH